MRIELGRYAVMAANLFGEDGKTASTPRPAVEVMEAGV